MRSPFYLCLLHTLAAGAIAVNFANALYAQRGSRGFTPAVTIDTGYLFIEDEYVAPPYAISIVDDILIVNDIEVDTAEFELPPMDNRRRGMGRPGGQRGNRRGMHMSPSRHVYRSLTTLRTGAVVLLDSDNQPLYLDASNKGIEFLKYLIEVSETDQVVELPDAAVEGDRWQQIASHLRPTSEFLQRAKAQVTDVEEKQRKVHAVVAARQLSERLMYPLTMFAFVLAVFAIGHLMSIAQSTFEAAQKVVADKRTTKHVFLSLLIVALLSVFDLGWTLLAHQTGTMREMNPIGATFIADPVQLVLFKAVVSGTSIALLFWLRSLPLARKAAWWCCLATTLLTIRWLTFNSLFA